MPEVAVRGVDVARAEVQVVDVGRRGGDRGPIVPDDAREVQVMVVRVDVARADKEHLSSVPQHECSSIHTHAHSGTILESTYRPLSRSQGPHLNLRLIKVSLREIPSQIVRPHLIQGITQGKSAEPMGLAAVSSDQPILLFMHGKLVIELILGANSDTADREAVVPGKIAT